MIDKQFLGIQISDSDDYGIILLRLAIDLHMSVITKTDTDTIRAKARNIVQICTEVTFDELITLYDWDPDEVEYAEAILSQVTSDMIAELVRLAERRAKYPKKLVWRTKIQIDDLKISGIMAYVMTIPEKLGSHIETQFYQEHGAMYFNRDE